MRKIEIKKSNDGSHTLFLPELNETYHSIHGAINESQHVFLEMGIASLPKKNIQVLEVGFGTGLNAFLTLIYSENNDKDIFYHTLEPYPIPSDIYETLNYATLIDESKSSAFKQLHELSWDKPHQVHPKFQLLKSTQKLEEIDFSEKFDVIYFDAFAPNKQPELWGTEILKKCYDALTVDGILVTYCSQGQFKRNLKAAGFKVESLPGPPGKREMTKAIKLPFQVC